MDILIIHTATFSGNTEPPAAGWDDLLSKDYFKRQTTASLVIPNQEKSEWKFLIFFLYESVMHHNKLQKLYPKTKTKLQIVKCFIKI